MTPDAKTPKPPKPQDATPGLFPPEIQRAMAASAVAHERAAAQWPAGVRLRCSDADSIYHGYPYLFLDAFPSLTLADVEPLVRGAGLIFDSVIVADRVMDEETDHLTEDVLRVEAMQFEGYRLLYPRFTPEAAFWDRFREYLVAYAQACLTERELAHPEASWESFTEAVAVSIAVGKCSLAKVAVAGLAALAGDDSAGEPLIRAVEQYYTARQMLDDLSDWREDLDRGFPSLLLARVAATAFAGRRKEQMREQRDRTRREIYYGGHLSYTMKLALAALAESDRLTAGHPGLLWRRQTASIRDRCQAVLAEVERIDAARSRRTDSRRLAVVLPAPANLWQEVAWDALKRLLHRWGATGAEPTAVAPEDGTSKVGDTLPLTLVTDALCDADQLLDGQLQPLIQSQADYFVYRRRPGGGWSYSAVSLGLPADSDHLGLVMRTLVRAERRADVEEHCSDSLSSLLEHGVREDGAIETWIRRQPEEPVPPACGPDAAVTAQLLEALVLYDGERFSERIGRGIAWIEGRQLADGSWCSGAYRGPFYATAACLRLLHAARPDSPAVPRAASFLRQARRDDGGWGHETAASDGMSTALALQGLALARDGSVEAEDFESARRAMDWLKLRPAAGGGDLTTAFILRAAVLWHRLETGAVQRVGS